MGNWSRSHLADHVLLRELTTHVSLDRSTTAELLADIAEVDRRKLYLPAAHNSMYSYCVRELHMSEETAFRRIRAARAARQFPAIFPALASGRLHLTAVVLLAPWLKPDNAGELLSAATHKSRAQIERLLAEHFPQPDVPTLVRAVATEPACQQGTLDPGNVPMSPAIAAPVVPSQAQSLPRGMEPLAPAPVVPSDLPGTPTQVGPLPTDAASRTRITPLSPGRFALQVTVSEHAYELLEYARALLAHAVPSGDVSQVLERALEALVERLEKQKFAKTSRMVPRRSSSSADDRYLPARVRRTVWQRDGGQCTFVSDQGKRCEARSRLEFDHVEPVARGGQTCVAGLRLRCRAHNQYTAECTFGAGFMNEKREASRHKAMQAKQQAGRQAP